MSQRALMAAACLWATQSFAQGTAVLIGTVMDASMESPVEDAVVTATAPELIGERVGVTDATGQYRIPNLPAGTYTLRLEKESFKPFARGDIQVRIDRTTRLNVELMPEALR